MKAILLLGLIFTTSFYCTLDEPSPSGFLQGVVEITKTHISFRSGKFQTSTKISEATKNGEIMVGTNPEGHMTNFNRYTGEFKLIKKKPLI